MSPKRLPYFLCRDTSDHLVGWVTINNAEQRPGMVSNMGHDKWQGKAWKSLEAAETSQICPGEVAKCLDFPCDMEIVFLDSTNS